MTKVHKDGVRMLFGKVFVHGNNKKTFESSWIKQKREKKKN